MSDYPLYGRLKRDDAAMDAASSALQSAVKAHGLENTLDSGDALFRAIQTWADVRWARVEVGPDGQPIPATDPRD